MIAVLQYFFRASWLSPGDQQMQDQQRGGALGGAVMSTAEINCWFQESAAVSELHLSASLPWNTGLAIWPTWLQMGGGCAGTDQFWHNMKTEWEGDWRPVKPAEKR